jgi:LuxR family transcriptional regulator, glucitol operon activator
MNNISAIRNTCFAILSAAEEDLRELVVNEPIREPGSPFLTDEIRGTAIARWNFDHKSAPPSSAPTDDDLIEYADFGDIATLIRPHIETLGQVYNADFGQLVRDIELHIPVRNRVCHSRPLEEDDLPECMDFAKSLLAIHGCLRWARLREVQHLLGSNPGFIFSLNIPQYWQVGNNAMRHNLPMPDYDETGFLGRVSDKKEVRKHLLAAHQVVTIVGEGGVGKSALAIHSLYDLLSLTEKQPYDAIIWTSLKTKTLTSAGFVDIKGSITSTLDIIEAAAQELGAPIDHSADIDEAIQEILEYMRLFRILLVIDNYETVTDQSLRPLLVQIPQGSKVLLTSRVGLGELEIRYKLDPLDLKTAIVLMRRFAKSLNLEMVFAASDKRLDK